MNTAAALRGLGVGLVGFSVFLFSLRGFYAHHDTRTPFLLNVGENGLNIALAVVLIGPFGVAGLGLALGIAYLVAALVAVVVLQRRWVATLSLGDLGVETARLVSSSLAAAIVMWAFANLLKLSTASGVTAIGGIIVVSLGGTLVYWTSSRALRSQTVPRLSQISAALSRAGGRGHHDG